MALKDPKSNEWKVLYAVAIALDILEPLAEVFLTELALAPEIIDELVDPIIGICFGIWFQIRGVSMIKRPTRLLAMVAADIAEQLSINVAPGWLGDIWYMHKSVKEEQAGENGFSSGMTEAQGDQPLNQGGTRQPLITKKPLNKGGSRLPNGGI